MWLKPAHLVAMALHFGDVALSAPRYPDEADFDAQGAAAATNAQVRAHVGSDAQLNANLARPLMSAQPMTAFDGREFEAQIACPSSTAYLELFAAPSGTGDITTLIVKQDFDVDGTLDRVYDLPVPVSGACANGVLACDPGTWDHCQAYRWEAKPSGELSLTPGPLADLGGCYCINAHCGHNLVMNNLAQVLGDLGGGAAAALSRINPLFMISRVEAAGPVIRYYGQDAGDCGFHGRTNQTHYYSHPPALAADAREATSTSLVLPNATVNPTATVTLESLYGLIDDSAVATPEQNQLYRCTIQRSVTLDEVRLEDIIRYNGGAGGMTSCGPGCLQLVIGTVGDNYWCARCAIQEDRVNFWVERPERIRSATLERAKFDDWMQVIGNDSVIWNGPSGDWTDLNGSPPGRCELNTSWDQRLQADFTPVLRFARGNATLRFRVAVSGCGEGYAYARVRVDESCRLNPDTVVNECEALETNPQCRLQEETVDGVVTYRHFNPTGLAPLPSAQTLAGQSCTFQPTRAWWRKQRRYGCRTGSAYAFDPAIERVARIQDSATPTGYDDVHLDENGEWITTAHRLQMPKLPPSKTCTQACKTRRTRSANDVAGLGPSQDVRNPKTTDAFFYHECDHRGVCPLGPGETMLKECQCLNDFAEATAILQSLRMAGRDMLCTRGTPVSLP